MRDEELEVAARNAELANAGVFVRRARKLEDFRYDEQQEKFWDITTGILLGGKSVDGAIPKDRWPTVYDAKKKDLKRISPSIAINAVETGLTVEGSTWWPGRDMFLKNIVITERGELRCKGAVTYNTYIAPNWEHLDSKVDPQPWIDHVKKLWPDPIEHEHFFNFAAHAIQKPHEKVNHGVVLSGGYGIGKDSALHPIREGVGIWNSAEIDPSAILSQYNGHVKSVLLVVNEVRPHEEDHHASEFYNRMKPLLAAPPDMTSMHMKYANVIYVRNLVHVILTTNDPLTMYIPADDRRLFVMSSPLPDPRRHEVFAGGYTEYFDAFWAFLEQGGTEAVIQWLNERDLREFNAAAPPAMTVGKKTIIESAKQVRRTPVDELLERFAEIVYDDVAPAVIFAKDLLDFINEGPIFDDKATLIKMLNAKNFHFKMDERGYNMVKNPMSSEWRAGKFRSRVAFVSKDVEAAKQCSTVIEELEKRPLAFEFARG